MKVDKIITLSLSLFIFGLPSLGYSQELAGLNLEPTSESRSSIQNNVSQEFTPLDTINVDIEIEPTVKSTWRGEQAPTVDIELICTSYGRVIPGAVITFNNLTVHPYQKGHDHHDDNRPVGSVNPPSAVVSSEGKARTTYTPPEVSGYVTMTSSCWAPGYTRSYYKQTISVGFKGLVEILGGDDKNYELTGSWDGVKEGFSKHEKNHYATVTVRRKLKLIADEFARVHPDEKLKYNDISLVHGGLFDLYGATIDKKLAEPWVLPHTAHRFGNEADIGLPTTDEKLISLKRALKKVGYKQLLNRSTHWHVRF